MEIQKKTKIVATLGPVTSTEKVLKELILGGMNVCRLNMSHGNHEEHAMRVKTIREASKKTKTHIGILQDLSGPKIRIGDFYTERINLVPGQEFTLTTKKCIGDEKKVFINYKNLSKEVKVGSFIMLDDGKKKLEVKKIKGADVVCTVILGGDTKGRRGVNLPGAYLKISSLTDKDREDLKFGIKEKVDFMALSFVRQPKDILELRAILKKAKASISIISKIETTEAMENLEEIIDLSDGVMVARGDLAIEIGAEYVPAAQKRIISLANQKGIPVITATQMLESMIHSPVPTRAEVSDIANAIYDGTDAVMLSEESTLGKYPLEAVSVMTRVAQEVERDMANHKNHKVNEKDVVDAVSSSVVHNAENIKSPVIFALSESGFTPRMISRWKPSEPIIALTPHEATARKLALSFGVAPFIVAPFKSTNDALKRIKAFAKKEKFAKSGEDVVISGGIPFGTVGGTNMMLILKV